MLKTKRHPILSNTKGIVANNWRRGLLFLSSWLIASWFLVGCGLTPEAAAVEVVTGPHYGGGEKSDVQILGRRDWPNKTIVVMYTRPNPPEGANPAGPDHLFGYQFITEGMFGWRSRGGFAGKREAIPAEDLVEYRIGRIGHIDSDALFVVGRVLSPQVGAVEFTFGEGQKVRDEADDGVFALLIPDSTVVKGELIMLNANDQIVRTDKIELKK